MEIRQLAHFVAVAEEGSFTRAAKRVHIVQSGISASISGLERELGAALFTRGRHAIEPTDVGRAFLGEARRVLDAVAAARATVKVTQGSLAGSVVIGVITKVPRELGFVDLIIRLHEEYPAVFIRLCELAAPMYDDVSSGEIDLAIGPARGPAGITSVVLASYEMVFVCGANHRLADKHRVTIGDLRDESFIETPDAWLTHRIVERAFIDAGITRRTVIEANQLPMMLELIDRGAGVSILPNSIIQQPGPRRCIPFDASIGRWDLAASFLGTEPANPVARRFLHMLVQAAEGSRNLTPPLDHTLNGTP